MAAIQPILLDWPATNTSGWGIVGQNIFLQWMQDPDVQPFMGAPITENEVTGYEPGRILAAQKAFTDSNRFQNDLARFRSAAVKLDMPVVKGLGNGLAYQGGVVGTPNVGRCVFEDTRLDGLNEKLAPYDVVVCASGWNTQLLRDHSRKRVELIYEGVDETLFRPGPRTGLLDQKKFYVFSGGKVEYRKGHDLVLLAFREFSLRHDDAVLVTAWHSPWPQLSAGFRGKAKAPLELTTDGRIHVKKWVAMNGINPDKVIEIPQIANPLMPGILCDMDCALFPSRAEACTNLSAKEAMACGIPVIVAANTGVRDIIDAGNCIPLMHQRPVLDFTECGTESWGESDVGEILDALERLYADSSLRNKIGRAGAAWILARGRTWSNHARLLKSLIMSC